MDLDAEMRKNDFLRHRLSSIRLTSYISKLTTQLVRILEILFRYFSNNYSRSKISIFSILDLRKEWLIVKTG